MSVTNTRAYHRALELYAARTGITPRDSTFNIVQDIVQAILEEIIDHSAITVGETLKFQLPPTSTISIKTFQGSTDVNEITATLTQDLTVVQK
jgi:hypothetical protein